jgi:hypothetical protein
MPIRQILELTFKLKVLIKIKTKTKKLLEIYKIVVKIILLKVHITTNLHFVLY